MMIMMTEQLAGFYMYSVSNNCTEISDRVDITFYLNKLNIKTSCAFTHY